MENKPRLGRQGFRVELDGFRVEASSSIDGPGTSPATSNDGAGEILAFDHRLDRRTGDEDGGDPGSSVLSTDDELRGGQRPAGPVNKTEMVRDPEIE